MTTPTRQSLEEYLKSCSDNEYAEYIISTMHGSCPSEWDKAIKEAIEAIRSRQHTSAPAFKRCCDSCINVPCKVLNRIPCLAQEKQENICEENGCTDIENCDEMCQHSRLFSPLQMQEAKQAAAKAEREKVLDKIMWYMANHGVEKRPEGYYVVSGTFSLGGFIKHIESLRAQQEGRR